jgi:hypothetical protein
MYSDFFDFNNPSFYELYCVSTVDAKDILYFRVKVTVKEEIHYLQLYEIRKENLTKLIVNNTQFDIEVKSASTKQEPPQVVGPNKRINYAQCHPMTAGSQLKITLVNREDVSLSYIVDMMVIKPEPQLYEVDKDLLVRLTIRFVGANTVLEINTLRRNEVRVRGQQLNESSLILQLGINGLCLSVMRLQEQKTREEFINMVFYRITAGLEVRSWSEMNFIGSIDDFQIDNKLGRIDQLPCSTQKIQYSR